MGGGSYAYNHRGGGGDTKGLLSAIGGGAVSGAISGLASGATSAAFKGVGIAAKARLGTGNYILGSANKSTAFVAKKLFQASNGLSRVRGPAIKETGPLAGKFVSNFERFRTSPVSSRLLRYPNRIGNGHLRIGRWW